MPESVAKPPGTERPSQVLTVCRIRYLSEAPQGSKVRFEFKEPRRMFAIEEAIEPGQLPAPKAWPEPLDQCHVVFIPTGSSGEGPPNVQTWMAPADRPESEPPVIVEREDVTVQWRPGRAWARGKPERREDVLAAVTEFAFYEGELRTMEAALQAREAQAQSDVAFAHRIRHRDREHWDRFRETIEYFSQMRLTFARLEPRLEKGSRTLAPEARRIMTRLIKKADVWDRLQAVTDRLESMENLYEGANDRVAEYRWYRSGSLLEIAIIVLLVIECGLIVTDMYLQSVERKETKAADERAQQSEDLSEETRAVILKVSEDKVTFARTVINKETQKSERGPEQTLPAVENVLVVKGKLDKETREVEAGDPIPGGLANPMFSRIGDRGIRVILVTDSRNKRISRIFVFSSSGN